MFDNNCYYLRKAFITKNGYEAGTAPSWVIRGDAVLIQFVEDKHAIYDAEAKEAVRQFWVKLGYECIENPQEFGVDLLVEGKGKKFGCEVEVKLGWHGSEFN